MVTDNHYRWDFIGLSTDVKPTPSTSSKVSDGSTFYCSDNSKLYVWYKNQWYERTEPSSGTTYTAGDGITISDDTISVDTTTIQPKLTAGTNITITDNVISATGGGSVTPVQTAGTSTTDVMSQNAVTSMVFDDPATQEKVKIGKSATVSVHGGNMAIGNSAGANGTQSTAIGSFSGANGAQSTAIGNSAKARLNGVSLGYNAQAGTSSSYSDTVAIGMNSYGGGDHCTAVGNDSNTINSYSTAVGCYARARSERSVAIGASAEVDNSPVMSYSVALGAGSRTTRAGEVNVCTGVDGISTDGFNSSSYRVIGGVYDGQEAHDVATVGQINATIDAINAALSTNIPHIGAQS